jgi:hypothetical protein
MKKTYLLLLIFFLASCSSSNNDTPLPDNNGNNNDGTPVLVTKVITSGETSTYSYNGSKLFQIINITKGNVTTFTYTNDLITQSETIGPNPQTNQYTYDTDKRLIKLIASGVSFGTSWSLESDYTYKPNNRVEIKFYKKFTPPLQRRRGSVSAVLNTDGSLSSWNGSFDRTLNDNPGVIATSKLKTVEYDTKNSPFKNITGYLKIIDLENKNGSAHNTLNYDHMINYEYLPAPTVEAERTAFKSDFEYNTSAYPIKETRTTYADYKGSPTTINISTFEYNHL